MSLPSGRSLLHTPFGPFAYHFRGIHVDTYLAPVQNSTSPISSPVEPLISKAGYHLWNHFNQGSFYVVRVYKTAVFHRVVVPFVLKVRLPRPSLHDLHDAVVIRISL